jgi:hypothetical protein
LLTHQEECPDALLEKKLLARKKCAKILHAAFEERQNYALSKLKKENIFKTLSFTVTLWLANSAASCSLF